MISSNEVFIWIPRRYKPKTKVEITHGSTVTDVTKHIHSASFRKKSSTGIGTFNLKIVNSKGTYSDSFSEGDTVDFYGDYSDGTSKRFSGRVDFIKEEISISGKYISIEGRHVSFPIQEVYVNRSYAGKTIDYILKDIVDNFLGGMGFTYNNVESFTGAYDINFSNVTVLDCLMTLADLGGADFYIDDDKDFHLFPENSKINTDDAIVEGSTLLNFKNFGSDDSEKRNKVRVYGSDENGLPIIYTAGTGTREHVMVNNSINTDTEAKNTAEAKLSELNQSEYRGTCNCLGLPSINEGENIWVSIPRSNILNLYKISEFTHILERRMWRTKCVIEKPIPTVGVVINDRIKVEKSLRKFQNDNDMKYSYSFTFDDDTNIESHSSTETGNGVLRLQSGQSSGTMVTSNKTMPEDITEAEIRYVGKDLGATVFKCSVDGGVTWDVLSRNTKTTLSHRGKYAKIRVEFNTDAKNVNPEVDSLSLLLR